MPFLDRVFYYNTVQTWIIAAGVVLVTILVLRLIRGIIHRRLAAFSLRTETQVDDLIADLVHKTKFFFLLALAFYAGAQALVLSEALKTALDRAVVVAVVLQGVVWAGTVFDFWINRTRRRKAETDQASLTTFSALGFLGRLALWSAALLLILDNLGIDVTTLIAGLGVGGIAVALAVQNILGDLFASMSIVLDKPFVIGDFIIVGDLMGTVEHVGLKTTRIRSLGGEQVIISNGDLLKSRIKNYKRMIERRVVFTIGVTYQTPAEKLAAIPAVIRNIIEARDNARFDRAHFREFGDFALLFEAVYYVISPDYGVYMDVQQEINLALFRAFAAEGIEFAYPTQTLYFNK
ncbi:MAG: mechanosensitive ion channel family protein [Candidatus Aminicenantes bacterium]|nr:mechanosensitive ion channel family protein [Candidatus Aminicenantes bacterium]